jgi:hypothetical protein
MAVPQSRSPRKHGPPCVYGVSERTQEAYLRSVRQVAEHFRTSPDRLSEH